MATVVIRIVSDDRASRSLWNIDSRLKGISVSIQSINRKTSSLIMKFGSLNRKVGESRQQFGMLSTAFKWYGLWWGLAKVQRSLGDLIGVGIDSVKQYEMSMFAMENLLARQIRETSAVKERIKVGEQRIQLTEEERLKLQALEAQLHKLEARRDKVAGQLIWKGYKTEADKLYDQARLQELNVKIEETKRKIDELRSKEGQIVPIYETSVKYLMSQSEALEKAKGKAKELYYWVSKMAILSPYSKQGVQQVLKTALAYGMQLDFAKKMTRASLDWAAAMGEGWETGERIVRSLGQMLARGKLTMEEVRELSHAGVPIFQWLQDYLGTETPEELAKTIRKGGVEAEKVIEYIAQRMEETYGGTIERMAHTLPGLIDSLKDTFRESIRPFAQGIIEPFKPFMEKIVERVVGEGSDKWFQDLEARAQKVQKIVSGVLQLLTTRPTTEGWTKIIKDMFDLKDEKKIEKVRSVVEGIVLTVDRLQSIIHKGESTISRYKQYWEGIKKYVSSILTDAENLADILTAGAGVSGVFLLSDSLRFALSLTGRLFNRFTLLTAAVAAFLKLYRENFGNLQGLVDRVKDDLLSLKDKILQWLAEKFHIDWKDKLNLDSLKNIDLADLYDKAKDKVKEFKDELDKLKEKAIEFGKDEKISSTISNLQLSLYFAKRNFQILIDWMGKFADEWKRQEGLGGRVREVVTTMVEHIKTIAQETSHILSNIMQILADNSQGKSPLIQFVESFVKGMMYIGQAINKVLSLIEKLLFYIDSLSGKNAKYTQAYLEYVDAVTQYREQMRAGLLPPGTPPPQPPKELLEQRRTITDLMTKGLGYGLSGYAGWWLLGKVPYVGPAAQGAMKGGAAWAARGAAQVLTKPLPAVGTSLGTLAGAIAAVPALMFLYSMFSPTSNRALAKQIAFLAENIERYFGGTKFGTALTYGVEKPAEYGYTARQLLLQGLKRDWEEFKKLLIWAFIDKDIYKKERQEQLNQQSLYNGVPVRIQLNVPNMEPVEIMMTSEALQSLTNPIVEQKMELPEYTKQWEQLQRTFKDLNQQSMDLTTNLWSLTGTLQQFEIPPDLQIHSPSKFEMSLMRSNRAARELVETLRELKDVSVNSRHAIDVNITASGLGYVEDQMAQQIADVLRTML